MGCKDKRGRDAASEAVSENAFQILITENGANRLVTLPGPREDYVIEFDDDDLEIKARDGGFEFEEDDISGFELIVAMPDAGAGNDGIQLGQPSRDDSSSSDLLVGGSTAALAGHLRTYDFLLQDGALIARNRFDGETETLSEFENLLIGGETFRIADLMSQLAEPGPDLLAEGGPRLMTVNTPEPTPSVLWDQILQSIIVDVGGGPTNAARAFSILHTAMFDAYASYDPMAQRVSVDLDGDNPGFATLEDASETEMETAMHFAGHHVLTQLFPDHRDAFDRVLSERLGIEGEEGDRALSVGLDAAQDVLVPRLAEVARLRDISAGLYTPVNADPDTRSDISRWTPEKQGVLSPTPDALQNFLTPELGLSEGFALPKTATGETDTSLLRPDGPEPFFTPEQADAVLNFDAATITLSAPALIGNEILKAGSTIAVDKSLIGVVINPAFIAQAEALVQTSAMLSEEQKLIAEFWEDGPGSSYPPGAWMTLAQYVSQRDAHDTGKDAHLFMTMGNAMMDAAIATWDAKVHFDYARPVTVIQDLGKLGLIGEPGTDELTGETGYVIQAFGGIDPNTGASLGTRTILAENFITYQLPGGEQSPPFAEYTSGHSAFSAAGATVLAAYTGADHFGARIIVGAGTSDFDRALPTDTLEFQWDTFSQAASEAGMSRIYGGIHFADGNLDGLTLGETVGAYAYELGTDFANGNVELDQRPYFDELFLV